MRYLLALLLLVISWQLTAAQPSRAVQDRNGAKAMVWLRAHQYLRETNGYNRAPLIDQWARANGNDLGSEWCGLTQWACQQSLRLPSPKGPAGSYNWFLDPKRNVLLGKAGSWDSVRVGYKIGIFSVKRGRIAHITAADELIRPLRRGRPARGAWCIGGNEGSGRNAGVHRSLYLSTDVYASSNYNY